MARPDHDLDTGFQIGQLLDQIQSRSIRQAEVHLGVGGDLAGRLITALSHRIGDADSESAALQ